MSRYSVFIIIGCLIVLTIGTPIKDGDDVGLVKTFGKRTIVFGQKQYPFMVNIEFVETKGLKINFSICGGVIIGRKAVLTAAHCIIDSSKATIHVHAGIVDRELEAKEGQRIKVTSVSPHENYQEDCMRGDGKCCMAKNDIAILWLEKSFKFGPTVQEATLSTNPKIPFHHEGWILGWGLNTLGKLPAMLQKGRVKVVPREECNELNPKFAIGKKIICLGAVNWGTMARPGDSGGPFVIDKMVYGLSSKTIFKEPCFSKAFDLYTFLPPYSDWIKQAMRRGPPQKEFPCIIC